MNIIPLVVAAAILLGSLLFAWMKGRPAERYGASVYFVGSAMMIGFEAITGERIPTVPTLLLDATVAMIFLGLAVRYNSLWLGAAMILQGIALGLHAMHLTGAEAVRPGQVDYYALGNDLVSVGIYVTFIFGTWATVRERRRQARASIPAAAPPFSGHLNSAAAQAISS